MPRGGSRQGTPGRAYPQRSDLNQAVRTAPSTHYGERVANERQQAAAPLPQSPGVPAGIAGLMAPVQGAPPAPGLFRDSENPNEPVTAGLPIGPGAGPSMNFELSVRDLLQAAARKFANPDIQRMIDNLDD